jgi:hypothetical protein
MWSEWLAVLLLLLVVVVMMMQHVACTVFAARPLLLQLTSMCRTSQLK